MDARQVLVTAGDLAAAAGGDDPPTVLDVRWTLTGPPAAELYLAGHVPGAVFVDLERELAAPAGPAGRHPLPEPAVLQDAMRRWGLRADSAVVVYDAADSTSAARAWWVLRWAGLAQVRVLDGGFAAWVAGGHLVRVGREAVAAGDAVVRPGGMPTLDASEAARVAEHGLLLDARSAERYRGEVEPIDPVAGHIPGAVAAPTTANVDAEGRFLDGAALRDRFAAIADVGLDEPGEVGTYCGSGVSAAHQVLALALAGIDAALYVGSWSEWVADPRRPVAVGPDPGGHQPPGHD